MFQKIKIKKLKMINEKSFSHLSPICPVPIFNHPPQVPFVQFIFTTTKDTVLAAMCVRMLSMPVGPHREELAAVGSITFESKQMAVGTGEMKSSQ